MSIYPDKKYARTKEVQDNEKKNQAIDYLAKPKDKTVREYIEQMKKAQQHARDKGLRK